MTIEEIKSVSIVQFLESQGYHHVYIFKENYGICLLLGLRHRLIQCLSQEESMETLEQAKVAISSIWLQKMTFLEQP